MVVHVIDTPQVQRPNETDDREHKKDFGEQVD